jgi:hypothetical protein
MIPTTTAPFTIEVFINKDHCLVKPIKPSKEKHHFLFQEIFVLFVIVAILMMTGIAKWYSVLNVKAGSMQNVKDFQVKDKNYQKMTNMSIQNVILQ